MNPQILDKLAVEAGMKSLLNMGGGSCVYTEGCNGVSQEHLNRFAELVAVRVYAAMCEACPPPPSIEQGEPSP